MSTDDKTTADAKRSEPRGASGNAARSFLDEYYKLLSIVPATIVVAILVQYIYSTYYILPLQARTLVVQNALRTDQSVFHSRNPRKVFEISCGQLADNPQAARVGIKFARNATDFQARDGDELMDFDWYQWEIGDGQTFGKQVLQAGDVFLSIKWASLGRSLVLKFEGKSTSRQQNETEYTIIVYFSSAAGKAEISTEDASFVWFGTNTSAKLTAHGSNFDDIKALNNEGISLIKVPLISKVSFDLIFKTEEILNFTLETSLDSLFQNYSDEFDKQFETAYGLTKRNLPGFYQEMGKSALSGLMNSWVLRENAAGTSDQNLNFKLSTPWTGIVSFREQQLRSFDEQTFPLLTLLDFDPLSVRNALVSWLNLFNELGENVNDIAEDGALKFGKPQITLVFLLLEAMLDREMHKDFLIVNYERISKIARTTISASSTYNENRSSWKDSAGIFGFNPKNSTVASFELHCLLEKIAETVLRISGDQPDSQFFAKMLEGLRKSREDYWNEEKELFNDLQFKLGGAKETFETSKTYVTYVPLLLKLLPRDSNKLEVLIRSLEKDDNWSNLGLRTADNGASLTVNYLLLRALKYYSEKSGPVQSDAHVLYSKLKNNIISYVAREFKKTHLFYEFYDSQGAGRGRRGCNWSSLILLIMAD